MSGEPGGNARYQLLDAWRGVAALGVLGFHSVNQLTDPGQNWLAGLLWNGWAGVFIFFPISGYCILAASHSAENSTVGMFLKRRWRRIFPTYWASVALAVALMILCSPLSDGSYRATLAQPGLKWISIGTLTQTFVGMEAAINPVYWSLCYEEQFYLVIAATMLCAASYRPALLLAVTVVAAVISCVQPALHVPPGLFIDRWLSFAVGLAAFGWFDSRYGRRWALAMGGLVLATEVLTWRVDYGISLAAAVAFVILKRHDKYLSSLRPVALLASVGTISYSLYLIHVPIAGRIVNGSRRFMTHPRAWWLPITALAFASAVAAAVVFYRFVEKRFQRPGASMRRAAEAAPTVAVA
jgi:peptidoglycan/LPS O-acetylase OafA/YrhL